MRVLLPPSETKNPGGRGRSLASRAPHPALGVARERVLSALDRLLDGPPSAAAAALLLPPATVDNALATNARVRTGGTMPALRRYAGTVYDGLAAADLTEIEQRLLARNVVVFSGLFGVVRGDEAIPAYRVPAKAALPGVGVAGTFWRRVLDDALPPLLGRGLVVDLRSSDYAAMWRPGRSVAPRVVSVRVLSPLPSGGLGVVSFPSKFAKGRLAAALARRLGTGGPVRDVTDVAAAWRECGGPRAEPDGPDRLVIYTA